jgi:NADP-dependent aldehyde dehydrogenase
VTERILLTGAAGRIGHMLRARLDRPGRILRLLDVVPIEDAEAGAEVVQGDLADEEMMRHACADVDAVVHLGGQAQEAPWEEILRVNVSGTRCLLEAVCASGVSRVVIASSFHAVGFRPWRKVPDGAVDLPAATPARPDSYYGWSKAAMEALGSLYADRFGLPVICVRIGSCSPRPGSEYGLSTWISPDDIGRLAEAALSTDAPGFRIVWGVSANTRRWWSLTEGEEIGYNPVDDAEVFADQINPDPGLAERPLGGGFCTQPLGLPFT